MGKNGVVVLLSNVKLFFHKKIKAYWVGKFLTFPFAKHLKFLRKRMSRFLVKRTVKITFFLGSCILIILYSSKTKKVENYRSKHDSPFEQKKFFAEGGFRFPHPLSLFFFSLSLSLSLGSCRFPEKIFETKTESINYTDSKSRGLVLYIFFSN